MNARNVPKILVDKSLPDWIETEKLQKLLRRDNAWSYVLQLWFWAGSECPNGNLAELDDNQIARKARWRGKADRFVSALIGAGFMTAERQLLYWTEEQKFTIKAAATAEASNEDHGWSAQEYERRKKWAQRHNSIPELAPEKRETKHKDVPESVPAVSPAQGQDVPSGVPANVPSVVPEDVPLNRKDNLELESHTFPQTPAEPVREAVSSVSVDSPKPEEAKPEAPKANTDRKGPHVELPAPYGRNGQRAPANIVKVFVAWADAYISDPQDAILDWNAEGHITKGLNLNFSAEQCCQAALGWQFQKYENKPIYSKTTGKVPELAKIFQDANAITKSIQLWKANQPKIAKPVMVRRDLPVLPPKPATPEEARAQRANARPSFLGGQAAKETA